MSRNISIEIDGTRTEIPKGITVKRALELNGYKTSKYPEKDSIFTPCETGGCWSCAVQVDGELEPACVTTTKDGLTIKTSLPEDVTPRRIVSGFSGHPVGGVGTPWWLKMERRYIETAVFAAGCNFRCPQCQNWDITYQSSGKAYTPREAAVLMTAASKKYEVDRMAISGGESTLNRRWLVQYVRELKALNPDENARIHVDTNASILTEDYIDELVGAGMTDVGPDLKGCHLETFVRITGVEDRPLAERYQNTAWKAVKYLLQNYKEKVFTGVGIPYNKKLISLREVREMGEKLSEIDPEVQVCVLDYRPEFKRLTLIKPRYHEMIEVHKRLRGTGLKTVLCQTERGHVGPELQCDEGLPHPQPRK
ncbi:MAG: radical SAM protein [Deltaproteobacteria bacterium]|nr:MAG: radical SAM protein [Deltaproteobacteria bacterium]